MRSTPPPEFGVYFFGNYPQQRTAADAYETLLKAARYADEAGFSSVWLPERHFHSFGGVFPNPSVLAAAVAARTRRIRINAGSVVLPLHDPIRVAEEWSVVDNLSRGRVGIGVASGWNSTDFVFYPDRFGAHRELMYEQVEQVRRLWRGQNLARTGGTGDTVDVSLYPRPLQSRVPMYTAVVGRRESFAQAARADLGIVTNLMTQDIVTLADNIAYYRQMRAEAGLDPAAGTVSVLVHTYLHDDPEVARREAFEPLTAYMRASLSLFGQVTNSLGFNIDLAKAGEDDLSYLFSRAYDRYCDSRALIGSPQTCTATVDALTDAGVDEIASLVDFGMPADRLLDGLPVLDRLRRETVDVPVRAPMSPGQQRMWFLDRLAPGNKSQNEPKAIRLVGALDETAFRRAVAALVTRHRSLRTVYRTVDGEPAQVVLPSLPVSVDVSDHTGQNEAEVVAEAISIESRRVFSLEDGPVFACRLLRLDTEHHVLVLSFHHIAVDAVSATVLTRDLSELYRAESDEGRDAQLPVLPRSNNVPPPEPAEVERGLAYWRETLGGDLPTLRLPADRPRPPVQTFNGRALFTRLGTDPTTRLREVARSGGATLFMALLAGLAATLSRFSGQDDLIVGVPISDRSNTQSDVVGFLINTVALRVDTSGDPSFADLLDQVRGRALDAFEHSAVPFENVVAELAPPRDMSRTPVFQVMAEYKSREAFDLDLPGVTATPLDAGREVSVTDLSLHLTHRDGTIVCHLEYSTDLFDPETITRIGEYFRQVLTAAGRHPELPLSELTHVTETDRRDLTRWQRGPETPVPDTTVVDRIGDHARTNPDAVAVADDTTELSYRELDDAARRLAGHLRELGVKTGDVVATWLPRSVETAVAQLGIMCSGAAYLPLDPALGPARVDTVLADSRSTAVITTAALADRLPPLSDGQQVVALDSVPDRSPRLPEPAPSDRAYVVYTSGSTGRPKGTVVSHRNLMRLCDWFDRRFGFGSAGHAAAVCGQSFDAAVVELWPTLVSGGKVTIAAEPIRRDPTALADWLDRTGCQFTLLPTVLAEEVLALPASRQPGLAVMMVGGDVLRTRPAQSSPYEVVNAYGPTEATVLVATYTVTPDGPATIPIGRPIDGTGLYVLDSAGRHTPVGVPGELHIGGESVAHGYLHAPETTARRFIVHPSLGRLYRTGDLARWNNSGQLEFCGRIDDQVKVRGYRVEPGESAALLRDHPEVAEAVVLPLRDDNGEASLAGYVVSVPGGDRGLIDRLRTHLSRRLPDYLIPTQWALVDRLPLNANGKVDRSALPRPSAELGTDSRKQDPTVTTDRLRELWSEVLALADVDESLSFFEAGGHSITAMRFLGRVRDEFGVELPVAVFYREPTLAALRRLVTADEHLRSGPVSYQQNGMIDGHTRSTTAWNIVVHLNLTGELDATALQQAADAVVRRHESLRSRFRHDGDWVQEVQPHRRVDLGPVDLRDASPVAIEEVTRGIGAAPFDIAEGHLIRFRLLRTGEAVWRLIVVVHHAVCDGWAISVLLDDLATAYRNATGDGHEQLPAATQAIDYATWQQRHWDDAAFEVRLGFWREVLRDRVLDAAMPTGSEPSATTEAAPVFLRRSLPDGLAADIDRLAADLGCTPFAVWAAALGILVARRTGHRSLALGTPYAAREHRDHDTVMAVLAMVSILRIDVDPAAGFGRLATEVLSGHADTVDNFVPLRRIVAALRSERDDVPAVMPTSLVYQSSMNLDLELPGVEVAVDEQPSGAPRKRTSFFVEPSAGRCRFGVITDGDRYDPATLASWLDEWFDILSRGIGDPDTPVAKLLGEDG